MHALQELVLERCLVEDVSPLVGLRQLRTVHLAGSRVGNDAAALLSHVPNVFGAAAAAAGKIAALQPF
jgi:hypothetical protein